MSKSGGGGTPGKKTYSIELKRQALERLDSGEPAPKIAKELGITTFHLKSWRGQVQQPMPAMADGNHDSTQDVVLRLIRDVAAGKIGNAALRLSIFNLIVDDIRNHEK